MERQGKRLARALAMAALLPGVAVTVLAQVRETQRLAACRSMLEPIARMPSRTSSPMKVSISRASD